MSNAFPVQRRSVLQHMGAVGATLGVPQRVPHEGGRRLDQGLARSGAGFSIPPQPPEFPRAAPAHRQERTSSVLVMSTHVHPVSLHTLLSAVPCSAR